MVSIRIAAVLLLLAPFAAGAQPLTLNDALARAYLTNPGLLAARAQLRSVDEGVSQANAGWRPTVTFSSGPGYAFGTTTTGGVVSRDNRNLVSNGLSVSVPVYAGGATRAGTNQAENRVYAQRSRLLATEQQLFSDTVTAFVNVIQSQQVLQLNTNNEQVLGRQLEGTRARYRIGEVTLTDVAQAEAALSGAQAEREQSQNNLQSARAAYRRQVGEWPEVLVEPQPLKVPVANQSQAAQLAAANNPTVIAALFDDAAARDAIDLAFSAVMPQLNVNVTGTNSTNGGTEGQRANGGQVLLNASVPIFQGGAEYSRIRQARQSQQQTRRLVDDARRQAELQAIQSWNTLEASRAIIERTRAQIRANLVALEGVTREASLGSRTTLDVLNAQQLLLNTRLTLVQSLANLVTNSYALASSVGRLSARDLGLNVPLYDETAYYAAVKNRIFGTGDFATSQPGR